MNEDVAKIFETHAELCKVIANPKRLMIIDLLSKREMCVGELARWVETSQSTVSQHLRLLKDKGFVTVRRDGQHQRYSLTTPDMVKACHIIRGILLGRMKEAGEVAQDISPERLFDLT